MRDLLTDATSRKTTLYSRRVRLWWDDDLLTAARRLRGLGEIMTMQATHPRMEVIALGCLRSVRARIGTVRAGGIRYGGPRRSGTDRLAMIDEAASAIQIMDKENGLAEVDSLERALFGFLSYDAAREVAGVVEGPPTHRWHGLPDYHLFLPRVLIRREEDKLVVVARGSTPEVAERVLARVTEALIRPFELPERELVVAPPLYSFDRQGFRQAVRGAQRAIRHGDVFQLVLSLGCRVPVSHTDALRAHARLAAIDPAALIFSYQGASFGAAGSCPPPFLSVADVECVAHAVAGSQQRGLDTISDRHAEARLVGSDREVAKHRMLVDLTRNDLGRVCAAGSVRIPELLAVERYANVVHLVSEAAGMLDVGQRPVDALRACFPTGAVTGTPKAPAMRLIEQLEPTSRVLFGGAVGLLSPQRALFYSMVRSATLLPGRVHLQAATGVVYDSDPHEQYDRCRNKLQPTAAALGVAV